MSDSITTPKPKTQPDLASGSESTGDDNEVKGTKLVLINTSLCLCTLLVGLVRPLDFLFSL